MSAPFYAADPRWWPGIANAIQGPWPDEACMHDLRWWEDQVWAKQAPRVPGYRALAARWGRKAWWVRGLMKRELEWRDQSVDKAVRVVKSPAKPKGWKNSDPNPRTCRALAAHFTRNARALLGRKPLKSGGAARTSRAPAAQDPRTFRDTRAVTQPHSHTATQHHKDKNQEQGSPDGDLGNAGASPALFGSQTQDPKPKPTKRSARLQLADQGLQVLRDARVEHHARAMGSMPKGVWMRPGTKATTAATRKVDRFLVEVAQAEVGDPLEVIQALAEWAYRSPDAAWLRKPGAEPLLQMLGGKANDPTNRLDRARRALAWKANPSTPAHRSGYGGQNGSTAAGQLLAGCMRREDNPERIVIDPGARA